MQVSNQRQEREILTELIELYCDLPCLWDIDEEIYKDKHQKSQAWKLMTEKLRLLEPDANVSDAKKKIQFMRTAYKREEKKIKESIRTGSGASDVHVPKLWYFKLLNPIFDRKDKQCKRSEDTLNSDKIKESKRTGSGASDVHAPELWYSNILNPIFVREDKQCKSNEDMLTSDKGTQSSKRAQDTKKRKANKKIKLIETARELSQNEDKKTNTFGVYVGEQLEQVATFQRQVAEKLISEILFLAKTGNLNFDTRIETPSMSRDLFSSSSSSSDPLRSPSPKIIYPSYSSQYTQPSPSPQTLYTQLSPSPQTKYIQPSHLPQSIEPPSEQIQSLLEERIIQVSKNPTNNENNTSNTLNDDPANSMLRELLIIKESK